MGEADARSRVPSRSVKTQNLGFSSGSGPLLSLIFLGFLYPIISPPSHQTTPLCPVEHRTEPGGSTPPVTGASWL